MRLFFLALLVGVVLLAKQTPLVPAPLFVIFMLSIAILFVALKHLNHALRVASLWGLLILVVSLFFANSRAVRNILENTHLHPGDLLDRVVSPLPGNPFCWSFLLIHRDDSIDEVALTRGFVSLWPSVIPVEACARNWAVISTLNLTEIKVEDERLKLAGQLRMRLGKFREISKHCVASAALRFYRAPYFTEGDGAPHIGDLRFVWRQKGGGFSEFELPPEGECPKALPPWLPPRMDLLF